MKTFSTSGTGNQQTLSEIESNKIPVYSTEADLDTDLANLADGELALYPSEGANLSVPVDEVKSEDMHAVTSNAVASALSYSTTEQKTGGKWINGKPIYKKVYSAKNISITGDNTLGVIDANLESAIVIGSVLITNGNILSIGYVGSSGNVSSQILSDKNLELRLTVYTVTAYDVIVFYTKTTD